jgi:hypothetical protein
MNRQYSYLRRNQVIGRSGPGSIFVTHENITVVITGLRDWWNQIRVPGPDDAGKKELRLKVLEANELKDSSLELEFQVNRFIQPPVIELDSNGEPADTAWFIPAARFPLWEYCPFSSCGALVKNPSAEDPNPRRCPVCKESGGRWRQLQQVPLIACCPEGHLDEIDWPTVAHPQGLCGNPMLKYREPGSAQSPTVSCKSCSTRVTLRPTGDGYQFSFPCSGVRAWLPETRPQRCTHQMLAFLRTSTGVYFPDVRSSLHLPPPKGYSEHVLKLISHSPATKKLVAFRSADFHQVIHESVREVYPEITFDETLRHIERARQGIEDIVRLGKSTEVDALKSPERGRAMFGGLPILDPEMKNLGTYNTEISPAIENFAAVVAVHRLAETRVLAGFTRVEPPRRGRQARQALEELWGYVPESHEAATSWLPATRVFGEGIFLEMHEDKIQSWSQKNVHNFQTHIFNDYQLEPAAVMVHTFAHLLINAASVECGYPVASIRDRIYFEDGIFGLLIYTAAGDSVGTMGGLVELANPGRLEPLIHRALSAGSWCALDPICNAASSEEFEGNEGACHQCCYLPETSCEWFNYGLDRATLFGNRASTVGFFESQLAERHN